VLAFSGRIEKTVVMQGSSDPNPELLDAAALCGHLVPAGSVHAFLAEHRRRLFPDELFADPGQQCGRGGDEAGVEPRAH
jgi:hypothetical protein